MSRKPSDDSDDEEDFKFVRPSPRSSKTIQQNRQPVEHDEKTEGANTSQQHSNIEITEEAAKLHHESILGCEAGTNEDLPCVKFHQNNLRRLAQSLGQVVYGTPEAVTIIVSYWSDIVKSRQRNDRKTICTMEVGSEGVLLNHALYLRLEQQYHYPDHYDRLTTPISSGQFSICSTESIRPLGVGQYGKVYQAVDRRTGQRFAEKIIQLEKFSPSELEILCQLDHEHVIKLYGVIRSQTSDIHILMQYGSGGNIQQLLEEGIGFVCSRNGSFDGIFAEYWSTNYYSHILRALKYLHSKSIVHCDVKLRNIVLSSDRRTAFLTDFGEARFINRNLGYAELSSIVGTMHYISPEVIDEQKYYCASDLWSAACCFLHCLTGKSPWTSLYPDLGTYYIAITKRPFKIVDEIPRWCCTLTRSILRSSFQEVEERKLITELIQLVSKSLSILDKTKTSRNLDQEVSSSVESLSFSLPESSTASAQGHVGDAHPVSSDFNKSNNPPQQDITHDVSTSVELPSSFENNVSVVDGQPCEAESISFAANNFNHLNGESCEFPEISTSVEPLSLSLQPCTSTDPVQAPPSHCSTANNEDAKHTTEKNCPWSQESDPAVVTEMTKVYKEYLTESANDDATMCELIEIWKKYSVDIGSNGVDAQGCESESNDQKICDELNRFVQMYPPSDQNQSTLSNENGYTSDES